MPGGLPAAIVSDRIARSVPDWRDRRGELWLMRPTVGSTWWSLTCAACHRLSWLASSGHWTRRSAGRTSGDSQIRYLQRIYAPDEQRCLCLFEAAGPDQVRSVSDIAQFPLARVVAVLSSVPDGASRMAGIGDGMPDERC